MRCERLTLTVDPDALAADLRTLVATGASVKDPVAEIIVGVRAQGDSAVLEYTRRFDTGGSQPPPLLVAASQLQEAAQELDPMVREGLDRAIGNVRAVAEAAIEEGREVDLGGHRVVLREAPVDRAGIYVPGGRAPYPSTVVMGVVTARVAGVEEVAVCAPPRAGATIDPTILAACRLAGASVVYAMGGAQAIAALAYGTESVAPVDMIVGPGSLYVQEAKRQVSGDVGIDAFAGPSDLFAIVTPGADPETIGLDLLAQTEHGSGSLVVAASPSGEILDLLETALRQGAETGAILRLVEVADAEQALALAQAFAPEHLQLAGPEAEALAPRATRAGCLFVGVPAGTAFGDYIAGSNHILPTGGAARFASGLSVASFRRRFAEVRIGRDAAELARAAAPIARAEGFELHARSMEARIRDNGPG
jgi:histidinol dehydrogenase